MNADHDGPERARTPQPGSTRAVSPAANPAPYQRRIGERLPIRAQMSWGPVPRSRWSRSTSWPVTIDNLSLSGVGFFSPPRPRIVRGQAVRIVLDGVTGGARVKVVRPEASGDRTYYGLAFGDRDMLEVARRLIGAFDAAGHRPDPDGP